jgi:RNA polymerase primary sigma factor
MKMHKFQASITEKNEVIDAYLKEIGKFSLVTPGEEKEICQLIIDGKKLPRQRLVEGNLRFVVSVAKQYQNSGLELMDLINEGNVGLIKASQMFDPSKGVRFISFAVWWIRQAIMESLKEKGRMVKLPLNQINTLKKISREMDEIMKTQGFTSVELAAASLGVEPEKYVAQSQVSLSTPLGEEDFTLGDTLSDGTVCDSDMENWSLVKQITSILNTLEDRENLVISCWFGINGQKQTPKFVIAKNLGLSEERIEQIFHKAIRKLKASRRSDLLRPFICK